MKSAMSYEVAKVTYLSGTIKYRPIFTCVSCGVQELGDEGYIELGGLTVDSLANAISNVKISRHQMPLYWKSNVHHVECPKCNDSTLGDYYA